MPPSTSTVEIEAIERGSLASGESAGGLLDPLLEARLVVPRRHVGTLRRTRLLRQLRSARDRPVISMVAPPGYGKSSLLVQWATEDSGPVAWLTADDSDSDPVVFLTDLAAAIDRRVPLGAELFSAIASDTLSHRTVVGRLLAAMSRPPEPVRIAIDDAHRITSRACLDILAELVEHLPEGSQVAIAGRARMRLPFARWRAEGSLLEIGPTELAMDEREAVGLGRELGLRLPAETATRLTRETEGWPALLALAILGARTSRGGPDRMRRRHRPPHRRLPAIRGARAPLHGRDHVPDPHVDPRRAARAAVRCRGGSTRVDRCPAAACTLDPADGRLRRVVPLPHAPARLPPA